MEASRPAQPTLPHGLSDRDIEVLWPLATDRSNPETAETLVVCVHTVIRHATHKFAKLNVANRTRAG